MADSERKYDEDHYKRLMACSDKRDMTEWNEFAKNLMGKRERILLEGAHLMKTHLEGAHLMGAHLEGAHLMGAHLEGACLGGAHLEGARLMGANLEGAFLMGANLKGARLRKVHLKGAHLGKIHLEGAHLEGVHLKGAHFIRAHLEGTNFKNAICDGETLIDECSIGGHKNSEGEKKLTDFRGVGLDNIRFSPGLKQLIEYSNRRLNWEAWYRNQSWVVHHAVKGFWSFSDYGRSTKRIVSWFFGLSLFFACIYCGVPDIIQNISSDCTATLPAEPYRWALRLLRSFYFSIITMTTLGFGDISANPINPAGDFWLTVRIVAGYIALTAQVIIGYVILGALVTRLSILFNSDGPSADFSKEKESGWFDRFWKRIAA